MLSLPKRKPIPPRVLASRPLCLLMAAGSVLGSFSPGGAQTKPAGEPSAPLEAPAPPAREGDVYDHRDHQPTESEVDRAEGRSGPDYPGPTTDQDVERGVENLLRQTDEMDKAAEKQGEEHPPGSPSQPPR
jgi:hypothetical protein